MKNYLLKLQETKGNLEFTEFQAISKKTNPVTVKNNFRFRSFLTAILLIVALTMGITPIYDVQGNTFDISSIYKHGKPIELSQQVGGATIIVSADHGVLPKGTTLSVHLLSDVEKQEYIRRLKASTDIHFIESVAYDISLLNSHGIEIQPNGKLTVEIDGVTFNRTGDKTAVYHVENSSKKNLHNISFSKKYIESENNDFSQSTIPVSKHNTIQSKPTKSAISFQTNHFSVYIVGTVATATYNFYVDGILTGSQIILNGEKLLEPNTPMELDGKMFSGWFLSGSSTPLTFGAPVTVNSTVNYDVHAVYEDIWYVYFNYNDNAIATKFVVPGNTTNPSGVPLLVTEPGKAFSHWSVVPDGPAFDFSTPINDNTTLYAVLTDLWTITFSAQGGSTTIPKYVADGQQMGTVTPPTRPGYSFGGWYTESNGTGNLYTETTSIQSSVTLFAKWTPTTVNYTIQYWLENADDEQYTFKETATGTGVSGETLILPSNRMENDRYPYFSFERYDQGLIINGNGTTLVNVYYSRNQYTVRFDLNRSNASMTIGGLTYTDSNNSSDWYSFTAKYDSDVSDLWPTATNVPRTRQNSYSSWYYFYGWSFSSGSSTYVSKRMTFTSDLFSTSGTRTYTGEWITNQTTYELHYMIESPSATGEKHYSGKWYNEDMTYNQTANTSGGSWNAKQISGVTNIGIETDNSAGSDDDIDVYFYYDRNTYQLSFYNYNHEDKVKSFVFGASMTDEYYTPEKPGTLPEGYTFDGWYDNFATSGTPINFASMVMPSNDAILYAKWTPPTSITIVHRVLEPPYPAGNTIEQITVPYGQPLDINVLNGIADVPTGYTIENDLLGWYWYVGDAFVPFDFNRPVYSNVEVFPVWKIETYQVVYDLNGATGTVPVDSKTYYAGANAIILPLGSDVNTPAGKVFTGWLHDENIYYPNEDVLIEGNTSMLAQWGDTPQKTALIYHANNGTGSIKTFDNLAMNQTHTVLANTDENLGFDYGEFTFTGWNTKADATGTWINAGNNIIVGNNSESESNQLYAQWAKITVTKTGVFNDTNVNGKADLGETIIYTFTITNNGLVGLNNIVISDPKISVSGSITFLAPGATDNSTLSGIYELTLLDLQESLVENTATVTGYSPELNIPVSDSDTEFTRLTSCMLEITCPVAFIATAECDLPSPATSVEELISLGFTISESCGNLVISSVDATDGNSNPETIHRTYTILDDLNSNNTPDQGEAIITCIQLITVQDNTAPVFAGNLPQDQIAECDQVPATASLTATDNCDPEVQVAFNETRNEGSIPGTYTLTRTWTATDNAGNSAQHVQFVTVQDNTAPVFAGNLPQDQIAECDQVPAAASLTATDNCDPEVQVAFNEARNEGSIPGTYTLTRTWTATDNAGNSAQHVQAVTVKDNTAPVFAGNLPQDQIAECDQVPAAASLTATDNCDPEVQVTFDEARNEGSIPGTYTLTRTWTATDNAGNSAQHVQVVTVKDNTAPVFAGNLPQDQIAECDQVPAAASLTATDNCDPEVQVTFDEARNEGSIPGTYTLTRTWTATDNAGNSAQHVQVVTVQDNTAPVFAGNLPQDQIAECDQVPAAASLTATDNCDTEVQVAFNEARNEGSIPGTYTLTRTWTATDNAGNSAQHVQVVTVQDNTAPVFAGNLPQDQIAECDQVPAAASLTATDNCDTEVQVAFNEARNEGSIPGTYTLTRTWTATDNAGNSAQHVQAVTVQDNTAPVFAGNLPQDQIAECDQVPAAASLTATDNCDPEVQVTFDEARNEGSIPGTYTLTRTWTATDNAGNSAQHIQVVTVKDNTAPVFAGNLPQDQIAECDQVPAAASLTATDNCDPEVQVAFNETRNEGSIPGTYTLTRTWTATDNAGNSAQHVQVVTVKDNTAPVFAGNLPQDQIAECDQVPAAASLTATDNCDPEVQVAFNEARNEGSIPGTYTLTRTWTATDNAGNSAQHVQVVTVQDNTSPVFAGNLPLDQIAECDQVPAAASLTATDNCDPEVQVAFNEARNEGSLPGTYTLTRTWTATDNAGNFAQHVQVVTVQDNTAPVFASVSDLEINCVDADNYNVVSEWLASVTAIDKCDSEVGVSTNVDMETLDISCNKSGNTTITWTAVDKSGNTAQISALLTIHDNRIPTFGDVVDLTVECDGMGNNDDFNMFLNQFIIDDPDVKMNIILAETPGCGLTKTVLVTGTATYGNELEVTASATFQIIDTTPPIVIAPEDITIEADENCKWNAHPEITGTSEVIDLCSEENSMDESIMYSDDVEDLGQGMYLITRTWTASDACGNSASDQQVITVTGGNAPPSLVLNEIDIYLTEEGQWTLNRWNIEDITRGSVAGCGTGDLLTYTFSNRYFDCSSVYAPQEVTVTATDTFGNSASGKVLVNVIDSIAPMAFCKDTTIYLDSFGQAFIVPGAINQGGDRESVPAWARHHNDLEGGSIDACGIAAMEISQHLFTTENIGANQVTLTAYDPSGNFATCEAIVTVVDTLRQSTYEEGEDTYPESSEGVAEEETSNPGNSETDTNGQDDSAQDSETAEETNVEYTIAGTVNTTFSDGAIQPNGTIEVILMLDGTVVATTVTDDEGNYIFEGITAGSYEVIVVNEENNQEIVVAVTVDSENPVASDINVVVVSARENTIVTSTVEFEDGMQIQVYPNPTQGQVRIDLEGSRFRQAEVTVYNVLGAMVYRQSFSTSSDITFDLSSQSSGMYIVKVDSEGTSATRKLILDRK